MTFKINQIVDPFKIIKNIVHVIYITQFLKLPKRKEENENIIINFISKITRLAKLYKNFTKKILMLLCTM